MSNANVGDAAPQCQASVDTLAQFFAGVKGDTGQIVAMLRELIDRLTDHAAKLPNSGEQPPEATPATQATPTPAPAPQLEPRPERKPWDVREAEVIQWLVALELQTGKLPTVRSIAQHAKINRGVVYRMDRFLQVYQSRKAEHQRLKSIGKRAKPPMGGVRGFRSTGGGVDAIYPGRDDGDDE